jgi:hypothetical protein
MPVANVNVDRTAAQFFERHVRWLQMRLLAHPLAWSLDLFSNPPLWAIVAFFVSGFKIGGLAILVMIWSAKIAVDSETTQRLRGQRLRPLWAFPLRDVALPIAAMISLGTRHINWRGQRRRIGRGSRLRLDSP